MDTIALQQAITQVEQRIPNVRLRCTYDYVDQVLMSDCTLHGSLIPMRVVFVALRHLLRRQTRMLIRTRPRRA